MTRIGKIARLPKAILDQLNHRLDNNEVAEPLLAWLNELPEVKQVLAAQFEGVPLSKQNLSQWRKSGFREWQTRQQALELVPDILSEADDLQPADGETLADKLGPWLAIRYYMIAKTMLNSDNVDQFKVLRTLCGDVSSLRRADHRLAQLKLNRERLTYEQVRRQGNAGNPVQSQPVTAGNTQSHQKIETHVGEPAGPNQIIPGLSGQFGATIPTQEMTNA